MNSDSETMTSLRPPVSGISLIVRGDVFAQAGNIGEAIQVYKAANAPARIRLLGENQLRQGNLDAGIKVFQTIGTEIPHHLLVTCGNTCVRKGLLEQAVRAYRMAGSIQHLNSLSSVCCKAGELEAALKSNDAIIAVVKDECQKKELSSRQGL